MIEYDLTSLPSRLRVIVFSSDNSGIIFGIFLVSSSVRENVKVMQGSIPSEHLFRLDLEMSSVFSYF